MTSYAWSLQCKAASKKNTLNRLSPPVAPFNAIRQALANKGSGSAQNLQILSVGQAPLPVKFLCEYEARGIRIGALRTT